MTVSDVPNLLKTTWSEFNEDKAPRLGAALAYYTTFSLAPLLVVVIAIAGLFLGEEAARGQIVGALGSVVGQSSAESIETMIEGAARRDTGLIATVVGLFTLILGASGVFGALQDALNTIWEVAPKPGRGWKGMIKDRFFSFTLVLGTGFLLLTSMVLTTMLAAFGDWLSASLPGGDIFWMVVNFVFGFAVITLLFALIFKIVPDVEIAWRDVWLGAAVTALLFSVGRIALGWYLGRTDYSTAYGAAGSLVLLLLWIYYSSQILFLGAEFTQVYANKFGSRVVPSDHAVALTEEARIQQGVPRSEDVEAAASPDHPAETVAAAAQLRERDGRDPARHTDTGSPARKPEARVVASDTSTNGDTTPEAKPGAKSLLLGAALMGIIEGVKRLRGGERDLGLKPQARQIKPPEGG